MPAGGTEQSRAATPRQLGKCDAYGGRRPALYSPYRNASRIERLCIALKEWRIKSPHSRACSSHNPRDRMGVTASRDVQVWRGPGMRHRSLYGTRWGQHSAPKPLSTTSASVSNTGPAHAVDRALPSGEDRYEIVSGCCCCTCSLGVALFLRQLRRVRRSGGDGG